MLILCRNLSPWHSFASQHSTFPVKDLLVATFHHQISLKMAARTNQVQDATMGEEVASTTIPPNATETPPKRNACIPSSNET